MSAHMKLYLFTLKLGGMAFFLVVKRENVFPEDSVWVIFVVRLRT